MSRFLPLVNYFLFLDNKKGGGSEGKMKLGLG